MPTPADARRARDDLEVTELYDRYAETVYRSIRRSLSHDDAEDVVQDAFLAARVRWEQVREYDSPVAFVLAVAHNHAMNVHRRHARASDIAVEEHHVPLGLEPRDHYADVEARLTVNAVCRFLSPRQRQVVHLFYQVDLPVQEIATLLGISSGNVKRSLSEARQRIRAELMPAA
jgi:RNA polymerase sigma-70 factor, ECF subfamily